MRYKYWGWIPILTRSLCLESGPDGRQELVESGTAGTGNVTETLLKMGYIQNGASYIKNETLTDYNSERALGIRYQLIITDIAQIDNIIKLELAIGRPSYIRSLISIHDDIILSGSVKIHPNGLVKYEFEHNGNYASEYADQMHIAIRNIFHRHDHHSSDLPLNTISSNSEQEAIKKIAYQYIQKFIEYKRLSTSAPPLSARDDLYRAKGEIEYATAYIDTNKKELDEESLDKFKDSLISFAHSFEILSERIYEKIEWGCNHAIWTLTAFLLAFTVVLAKDIIDKWHPQDILGMTAFSIVFWISISLAFFLLLNMYWCFTTPLEKSQ